MIQIVEGLYLGNRESARDLRRLREAGITHIVNCTEELPNYHEGQFVYLSMKMVDPDPCFRQHLTGVCAFIDDARRQGKVLVHCFASISRSPAVVLTYLCHLGEPLDRAAERLAKIVWTSPDRVFLAQLAEHLGLDYPEDKLRQIEYTLQSRPADEEE
jgi:Dual specificity phosphatase, catalytic domain